MSACHLGVLSLSRQIKKPQKGPVRSFSFSLKHRAYQWIESYPFLSLFFKASCRSKGRGNQRTEEIRRCQLLRVRKEEEQLVSGWGQAAATDALQAGGGVSRNIVQITSCEIKGRWRTNHSVRPGFTQIDFAIGIIKSISLLWSFRAAMCMPLFGYSSRLPDHP
ncbi:unnamed protein product [Urochloa humidicola]